MTQADITTALTILAMQGGDAKKASKEIKGLGEAGLRKLAADHEDDYRRIQDRVKGQLEEDAIRTMRERLAQAAEGERLAIQKVIDGLHGANFIRPSEAAQTALSMSRVKATNMDKLLAMTGRPNHIIEDRTAQEAVRSLVHKRVLRVVEDDVA